MNEETKSPLQLEAIEKETRQFECPCCHAQLQFRTRIHITSVGEALTPAQAAERDGRPLMEGASTIRRRERKAEYAPLLQAAKEFGVLTAFNQALDVCPFVPIDKESYFIKWLSFAEKQNVPQFALRQCISDAEYLGGSLTLWGWQNVSVVMNDNEFKLFLPRKLVNGELIEKLTVSGNGISVKKQTDVTTWIRTRYGYVEKSGEFANAMRQHSIGAFSVK